MSYLTTARLCETGVRLLGHLDRGQGARPFHEPISDAHRYREWDKTDGSRTDRRATGAAGAGGDAWEPLPGYWDDFVSHIGPGVSE
ncbi:hypothetical protein DY245_38840 [Streptomyces inhibens]|uniref:Uncharacterized protein n=1 Tax=Streptomyces inhibens TaxID=2293571 RepID=A0A371PRZ8_STRIH|nr:hypothetical protein [Streptomyces inhibens]REK85252.1 hypothetical protein DY245_38840 [Streptomyces inhibens]